MESVPEITTIVGGLAAIGAALWATYRDIKATRVGVERIIDQLSRPPAVITYRSDPDTTIPLETAPLITNQRMYPGGVHEGGI